MGPSVKFVGTIIDAFPNQKNGGNFFVGKKDKRGWGWSEGGLSLGRTFSDKFARANRFPNCRHVLTSLVVLLQNAMLCSDLQIPDTISKIFSNVLHIPSKKRVLQCFLEKSDLCSAPGTTSPTSQTFPCSPLPTNAWVSI